MKDTMLFNNYKHCKFCGKTLPVSFKGDYCPGCVEHELFQNVKQFIRENNINEHQVALYFDIPVAQVKQWIKEGRIEYKETGEQIISSIRCQNCGVSVQFGTLCTKCLHSVGKNLQGVYNSNFITEEARMRFKKSEFEAKQKK